MYSFILIGWKIENVLDDLGLAAILKSPTSEISYIILKKIFSKMYSIFKIDSKLQKLQNFNTTRHLELIRHLIFIKT
jgi:hypothetical protein